MSDAPLPTTPAPSSQPVWVKLAVLTFVGALFGFLYFEYRDALSLKALAEQEAAFRNYRQQNPVLVYGVAFGVYVTMTGLSLPPGAGALTLMYGWLFGFWRAVLLVSFASTAGATLAFLLARFLLRDTIQKRFGDQLRRFNAALQKEGAFYLFTLRLIVGVPFFVINLVIGLTPLSTWTFWWVSQLGMLPGTCVYVYAGSSVPSLDTLAAKGAGGIFTPQVIAAFALLGVFPLIAKKVMAGFRTPTPESH